ncbi:MAG: FtsW/RodA/SpoVE family cell cycle protein [Gemella sp.]|nr:FtsW/RodA/SpoVE family cell cycle protein [Gemella sp.]
MNRFKQIIRRASKEKRLSRIDLYVTISLILLLISSCIMVYSATMIGNKYGMFTNGVPVSSNYFLSRQSIWALLSLGAYLIFATVPYEIFKDKKYYSYGFLVISILLLLPRLGSSVNGAYSWINIGGFTFQPSVLAQIFVIAYMALILESRKETLRRPTKPMDLSKIFAVPLVILFLIFTQNDTGTMLITIAVVIIIMFCANISFRNILLLIKIGLASLVGLALVMYIRGLITGGTTYQINRIKTFFDPFSGTSNSNEHIINSMISFGNGGLFGKGLGNSIQKLGYLPEAHTDFILAITAEEFGFLGVVAVVMLLIIIIIRILYAGLNSGRTFESIFALGFAALLFTQTMVNIGGVSAALPMTGVPIPFYSFGGSSMLVLSATLGIVMNLLSHIKYVKGSN